MELYLIRHTTPDISKGICYGQTDIPLAKSFPEEAARIASYLPEQLEKIYSSPLLRCRQLAATLFPAHTITYDPALQEINCGNWEMCSYDALPQEEVNRWMNDYVNMRMPGGENYADLYQRVVACIEPIISNGKNAALITHSGVMRSVLCYITGTPLQESFRAFGIEYGSVWRIDYSQGSVIQKLR